MRIDADVEGAVASVIVGIGIVAGIGIGVGVGVGIGIGNGIDNGITGVGTTGAVIAAAVVILEVRDRGTDVLRDKIRGR